MDDEKDMLYFKTHLKSLLKEFLNVLKKKKTKVLIILLLLTIQMLCGVIFVQSIQKMNKKEKLFITRMKRIASSDLPVFTFCSKDQYKEDRLKRYGIQSSNSYAMDTDWVGTGSENPEMIFEDSVLKLEDIITDMKVYLDKPTPEGQSIVRKETKTVKLMIFKRIILELGLTNVTLQVIYLLVQFLKFTL